ncbi:MAG: TIGR00730 family Rossman fold protein [Paludibacteraceae bacterium]|nr:TIGR00730 family Rossman fold protein [Paludibacteraceae bacterium]
MNRVKNIGIYCASSTKVRPAFFAAARRLGELFAQNDITLVFGAGNMGLMGEIADAMVAGNGKMIGVIPDFMIEQDWHHKQCTELIVTEGMSDRKQTIERISDAFVALPGGIGTMDELFECMVDKQLGLHIKPIVILNVDGYYDGLVTLLDQMIEEQMMRPVRGTLYEVVTTPEEVIPAILNMPAWDPNSRKHAKI